MDGTNAVNFIDFLAKGNIICNSTDPDCASVIASLAERLCDNTAGLDKQEVVEAVMAREKLFPTVMASGLAIPHARMENVDNLLVALAISPDGISFNAPDMPPVKVVAMLLTPKNDPGLHLQVLAALAKDFQDPDAIDKVAAIKTPEEVLSFFKQASIDISDYIKAKDVMDKNPLTLDESDTLSKAIETFSVNQVQTVPVIDRDGDLRGTLSLRDILKFSLPEHILWMDDLSTIYRFEPFAEMLKDDKESKLADFMSEQFASVDESVPAIQLAKIFLMEGSQQIIVVRNGKLAGVVKLKDFVAKLFWE
ncbi:MAG: PTS transporter subunit EIIA [Kiritimatiellaeota bacterium]|nr:PTS transporter subunit EIIA [Kiritimatiellota bacterium]